METYASDTEIAAFEQALTHISPPEDIWQPRKVFLFSGHIVDASDRPAPRFPNHKSDIAAAKIGAALDQFGANSADLALTQGAAGGDILFAEACEQRGLRIHLLQPFPEALFMEKSVLPVQEGENWKARYLALSARFNNRVHSMPDELGRLPEGGNPYERCNLWLLHTALAWGIEKVHFICLWDGGGGGRGGTAHMYEEVEKRAGQVVWLDTRKFW